MSTRSKCFETEIVNFVFGLSKELKFGSICGLAGNELELLAIVRNCKFLYDKSQFKDTKESLTKCNSAWMGIATLFQVTEEQVKEKWNYIRKCYVNYKRGYDINTETSISNLFDDLHFLDPYIDINANYAITSDDSSMQFIEEPGDILKLISLVKLQSKLYDKSHSSIKSKPLRDQEWIAISEELGLSPEDCENKWKRLRERYGRERKSTQMNKGRIPWEFYKELDFLDSHVRPRRMHTFKQLKAVKCLDKTKLENISFEDTLIIKAEDAKEKEMIIDDDEDNSADLEYHFITENDNRLPKNVTSPEVIHIQAPVVHETLNNLNNNFTNSFASNSSTANEEDDLFGQTIAAELKKIKGKKKMKLKADIYRLLYENEESD